MKKIEAVVFPHELEIIRRALLKAGILNMMVSEIRDYGTGTSHTEIYRNEEYTVDSKQKCKLETIVPQSLVSRAISIISENRKIGKEERSAILISTVNDVKGSGAR